jgi:hypothetical protein
MITIAHAPRQGGEDLGLVGKIRAKKSAAKAALKIREAGAVQSCPDEFISSIFSGQQLNISELYICQWALANRRSNFALNYSDLPLFHWRSWRGACASSVDLQLALAHSGHLRSIL